VTEAEKITVQESMILQRLAVLEKGQDIVLQTVQSMQTGCSSCQRTITESKTRIDDHDKQLNSLWGWQKTLIGLGIGSLINIVLTLVKFAK
jgi:hypothetical protein